MHESWTSWLFRVSFNLWPCYRGTGGRLTYVSADYREIHVRLRLNWRTRNYVGSIFGGSLYGAVDPLYMLMLIRILGNEYVVWDKAANIQFKRPGRSTLYATFQLDDEEIEVIREATAPGAPIDRHYVVELKDKPGKVHATIDKTIYIRRKAAAP